MKRNLIVLLAAGLLCGGSVRAQQVHTVAGSDMESWHSVTTSQSLNLEAPDEWYGSDKLIADIAVMTGPLFAIEPKKQLFKSTDSHEGSLAAEIKTDFLGDSIGNMTGIFSNAKIELDVAGLLASGGLDDPSQMLEFLSYTGGTDVTGKVDTVAAWVKCNAGNQDSAAITVLMLKTISNDSSLTVGTGYYAVAPSVTSYQQISVPISYTSSETPDKMVVLFLSSTFSDSVKMIGNGMKVDGVTYSYGTTGIHTPLLADDAVQVYPNPTDGLLHFNIDGSVDRSGFVLTVTDVAGRVIYQEPVHQANQTVATDSWAPGVYYYLLSNAAQATVQSGQFSVR